MNSVALYEGIFDTSHIEDTNKKNLYIKLTGKRNETMDNVILYLNTLMGDLYAEIENSLLFNIK
jgi:hypothetical protein